MTNWENIVSGKELITAKNKRKNLYIEARERKVALEELEEEGWEYVKDYADSKFVKVRKEKPFYERFEDQIWLLFFQMGFKHLNRDANFKMNYDFNNPDFTQQIDVFAADDETIQAIQLALQKCSFFSTFAKNNTIATNGSFDVGDNQATIDRFYPFLEGCFKTVKNECETEWSLGEQGILTINRGIQGIIRIINDVVNLLIAQNKLFPLTQDIDDIINEVEYYMSPLLNHINKLTEEQRIELKSFYGGGAENKYLHYFQKVIHDSLTDFNPEGLEEYIENTTKEYNATSKEYIYAIEEKLKDVIAESLQEYYGDKWLIKGLPKTTYKEAEKAASDKNYELLSNDEESDIEPWDCISLSDCKDIVVYSRNWSEIFESIITRPEDLILSTKEQKTEWINTISKEQNKLSKSTYSVPKSSFELISNIYAWLVGTD